MLSSALLCCPVPSPSIQHCLVPVKQGTPGIRKDAGQRCSLYAIELTHMPGGEIAQPSGMPSYASYGYAGDYGRASSTRLTGVCVARRNRVKPPCMTTSRNLASPACAPNAAPPF